MDCASLIPKADYGDFSKRLHSAVIKGRIPVGGSIDLTNRCNLGCVHCYIRESSAADEMSTDQVKRIIDEIAAAGCLWLLLTGGEPLLRSDFQEIYLHARKKGMLINLFTNATLITEEIADFLAEWTPFAVEVSIYGMSEETYESVTGVSRAYERCLKGIRLLHERKIPLRLKSVILNRNHHELRDMMQLAGSLGVEFRYDTNIHGRVDGGKDPCSYRLSPEDVVRLDFYDRRRISALREFVDYASSISIDKEHLFHCGAGLNSFHVGADGRLYLCMMFRAESYDLSRGTFAEGWNGFIHDLRYQKASGGQKCTSCEHYFLCGQCPAWGQLETDDKLEVSEFLCKLAHLRAEAFSEDPLWTGGGTETDVVSEPEKQ